MDYVIKAEFPNGNCRYLRIGGFEFVEEFELATRFPTLKQANKQLPRCRKIDWYSGWRRPARPLNAAEPILSVICC